MKKASKWIGGLVGLLVLLLVTALVVPFLIDFNKFKPQIQAAVSANLNATIDFESARLQVLPGLGIKVKGVKITNTDPDFNGTKLFSVGELFFQTELMPLFQKQFKGELLIDKPEFILARKGLKNNLASLAKPADGEKKPEEPAKEDKAPATPEEQAALMKMIKESVLMKSVAIKSASLAIQNIGTEKPVEPIKITDFNLMITDIGLDRDIKTEITTAMKVAEAGAKVSGPIKITMVNRIKMGGEGLELATFDGKLDFDQLNINAMGAFVKAPGVALNVAFKGEATTKNFKLETMTFNLHNLAVGASAAISDFKSLDTIASVSVKNDDLVKLGDVLPQHKAMLVNATINLDASIDGPLSQVNKVKANVDFATKLSGSDFTSKVRLTSLEPMNAAIAANSTRLDLGAILKPFLPPPSDKPAEPVASPAPGAEVPEKEFELTAEQKKMLAGADIAVDVSLKEIIFDKLIIKNFIIKSKQNELIAKLEEFGMDIFGGNMKVTGVVNLGTSPVSYENTFALTDIHPEELTAIIKPEHKDLLKGMMSINLAATGKGTTKTSITKNLNGKGDFAIKEGELNTPSVAGEMQNEFDKFIGSLNVASAGEGAFKEAAKILDNPLLKKIPGASAQSFDLNKYKEGYAGMSKVSIADKASINKSMKDVKGQIEIKDGRIYITSKKPSPSGNFDFLGSVGLDMTLGGKGVFAASDSSKAKMVSQSKYASLMFDQNKNLNINMNLGGTVMEPKVSLDLASIKNTFQANAKALVEKEVKEGAEQHVNKFLKGQKDALANELKKKQDELKAKADEERKRIEGEARKKAEEEAKKKGTGAVKDKLKGLLKK